MLHLLLSAYSLHPTKKINLWLNVTHPSIINLERSISRFVVLGCVTFSTRLVFTREYFNYESNSRSRRVCACAMPPRIHSSGFIWLAYKFLTTCWCIYKLQMRWHHRASVPAKVFDTPNLRWPIYCCTRQSRGYYFKPWVLLYNLSVNLFSRHHPPSPPLPPPATRPHRARLPGEAIRCGDGGG